MALERVGSRPSAGGEPFSPLTLCQASLHLFFFGHPAPSPHEISWGGASTLNDLTALRRNPLRTPGIFCIQQECHSRALGRNLISGTQKKGRETEIDPDDEILWQLCNRKPEPSLRNHFTGKDWYGSG